MIIECPECSARFRVADEKIKPGGIKVRCSKCKAVFPIELEKERRFSRPEPERRPPSGADPFSMEDPFEQTAAPFAGVGFGRDPSADESGAPSDGFSDNPFEREDPFAVTAFGQGAAGEPDSFDLDQGAPPRPPARWQEPAPKGPDPFEREDPFAATSFEFGKKSSSNDGAFDFSLDDDPSITAGPIPGLETNSAAYGGANYGENYGEVSFGDPFEAKAPGRADMLGDDSVDGDISMLGDPGRAQMMLDATAPDDPEPFGVGYGEIAFGDEDPIVERPAADRRPKLPRQEKDPRARKSRKREAFHEDASPSWPKSIDEGAPRRAAPTTSSAPSIPVAVIPPARSVAEASDGGVRVLQGVANFVLILMIIAAGFLGYVALMNDWLLDLRALDDMTAHAFGEGTYTPRDVVDARVNEEAVAPPEAAVEIEDLKNLYFPNGAGAELFIIEGQIVNRTEASVRKITLTGEVFDEAGERIGQQEAPAGRPLSEDELMDVVDAEALKAANGRIAVEAEALEVKPGQGMRFSLVFLDLPGDKTDKRTFKVSVQGYEGAEGATPGGDEKEPEAEPPPPEEKPKGRGKKGKGGGG